MWPELFYIRTLSLEVNDENESFLAEYVKEKIQNHKDRQRFLEERKTLENSFKYKLKNIIKKVLNIQ
jgi:hypothetical protein